MPSDVPGMAVTIVVPSVPVRLIDLLLLVIAVLLLRIIHKLDKGISLARSLQKDHDSVTPQSRQQRGSEALNALVATKQSPNAARIRPLEDRLVTELTLAKIVYDSAQRFAECLLDDADIDVNQFLRACRHYTRVLEKIGPFTMLSVRETHSNLSKIETTYLLDPVRFRSMVTMLEEEVSSAMHSPGGVLADPSAAIGLLWARRGLSFWISLFRPHVERHCELKKQREAAARDEASTWEAHREVASTLGLAAPAPIALEPRSRTASVSMAPACASRPPSVSSEPYPTQPPSCPTARSPTADGASAASSGRP